MKRSFASLLTNIVLTIFFIFISGESHGQVFFTNNFNHYSEPRPYTELDMISDWDAPDNEKGVVEGRVDIVTGAEAFGGSGACLSVKVPRGSVGTGDGGAAWEMELPELFDEVELTYQVKFSQGFDFVRGGKLPGLAGETVPSGQARSSFDKGWAGRLMWRTEDLPRNPATGQRDETFLVHYLKHPTSGFDQDGKDEDNLFWHAPQGGRLTIVSGKWYKITQRIRMNDPGKLNARVSAWLDGVLVHDETGFAFRGDLDRGIDKLFFSVFFGGGDSTWEATKDETILFDEFSIRTIPLQDRMEFLNTSPNLKIGDTTHLAVDYALSSPGYLNLDVFAADGSWITGARHFLGASSSIESVPISIPANVAPGALSINGFITTVAGDWRQARYWATSRNGLFVNEEVTTDELRLTEVPPVTNPGGDTGVVKVIYKAATDGNISVSLMSRTNSWIGGGSAPVSAGEGTIEIPFVSFGGEAADYRFHAFMSTSANDWQSARVWASQAPTTVGP